MERNPAREDRCKHAILQKTNTDVTVIVWSMLSDVQFLSEFSLLVGSAIAAATPKLKSYETSINIKTLVEARVDILVCL